MTAEITTALVGLGVAAIVAIASVVAVLGKRTAQYLDKLFDQKERELLRQAGEEAALYAEEQARSHVIERQQKFNMAREIVRSQAPAASDGAVNAAVVVGVAKMRASIPTTDVLHTPIPVTVVSSIPPTLDEPSLPAPGRVPGSSR